MDAKSISLVQESFARVVPIREAAAAMFYDDLFATAPEVKPYFADAEMKAQGAKLMATLATVVRGLDDLPSLLPMAEALARKHVGYGVQAKDYSAVGVSLIRTLEKGLGEDFTPAVKAAWLDAYTTLSGAMISAAYGSEAAE